MLVSNTVALLYINLFKGRLAACDIVHPDDSQASVYPDTKFMCFILFIGLVVTWSDSFPMWVDGKRRIKVSAGPYLLGDSASPPTGCKFPSAYAAFVCGFVILLSLLFSHTPCFRSLKPWYREPNAIFRDGTWTSTGSIGARALLVACNTVQVCVVVFDLAGYWHRPST